MGPNEPIDNASDASDVWDKEDLHDYDTSTETSMSSSEEDTECEDDSDPPARKLRPRMFYSGKHCTRWNMAPAALQRQGFNL